LGLDEAKARAGANFANAGARQSLAQGVIALRDAPRAKAVLHAYEAWAAQCPSGTGKIEGQAVTVSLMEITLGLSGDETFGVRAQARANGALVLDTVIAVWRRGSIISVINLQRAHGEVDQAFVEHLAAQASAKQ
jgi:hypothetical protein